MKGISTVVATILMLMITIALAATAYMYINGMFIRETQGIQVTDHFCSPGNGWGMVNLAIRNIGTTNITSLTSITCTQTSPAADAGCNLQGGTFPLEPGQSTTIRENCTGTGSRSCLYRIVPPTGSAVQANVPCT